MQENKRDRGFSMIEVFIAIGVMAVIGLGMAQMFKAGHMSQKTLLAQDDARTLVGDITTLLSDPAACLNSFGGLPITGTTFSTVTPALLKDSGGNVKYSTHGISNAYGNKGLRFTGLVLGGAANTPEARSGIAYWSPDSTGNNGTALVQVQFTQTGSAGNRGTGPADLQRFFLINATLTGGLISACTAQLRPLTYAQDGNGTVNHHALWTSATTLGDSPLYKSGSSDDLILDAPSGIGLAGGTAVGNTALQVGPQIGATSSMVSISSTDWLVPPLRLQTDINDSGTANGVALSIHNNAGGGRFQVRGNGRTCIGEGVETGTCNGSLALSVASKDVDHVAMIHNTSSSSSADGLRIQLGKNAGNLDGNNRFLTFTDRDGTMMGRVNGDGSGGVNYIQTSDRRIKANIRDTSFTLEQLMKVQVRDYSPLRDPSRTYTGFVAQELHEVIPQVVSRGRTAEDFWSVAYGSMTPFLTKAVQELYRKFLGVEQEVENLKRENASLKRELEALRKRQDEILERLAR